MQILQELIMHLSSPLATVYNLCCCSCCWNRSSIPKP